MKCPKCNYISFDYLDSCKKCGKDLSEHKEKHNIRSLLFAGAGAGAVAAAGIDGATEAAAEDEDFTFDFMEGEEQEQVAAPAEESPPSTMEPADDPLGGGEDSDDFSFDSDDTFSFDDDEL